MFSFEVVGFRLRTTTLAVASTKVRRAIITDGSLRSSLVIPSLLRNSSFNFVVSDAGCSRVRLPLKLKPIFQRPGKSQLSVDSHLELSYRPAAPARWPRGPRGRVGVYVLVSKTWWVVCCWIKRAVCLASWKRGGPSAASGSPRKRFAADGATTWNETTWTRPVFLLLCESINANIHWSYRNWTVVDVRPSWSCICWF